MSHTGNAIELADLNFEDSEDDDDMLRQLDCTQFSTQSSAKLDDGDKLKKTLEKNFFKVPIVSKETILSNADDDDDEDLLLKTMNFLPDITSSQKNATKSVAPVLLSQLVKNKTNGNALTKVSTNHAPVVATASSVDLSDRSYFSRNSQSINISSSSISQSNIRESLLDDSNMFENVVQITSTIKVESAIKEERFLRHAEDELGKKYSNDMIKLVLKHTICYYFRTFFGYDLLVQKGENVLRKLPVLLVYVKEVDHTDTSVTLFLSDVNNSKNIKGTVDMELFKRFRHAFNPGTILFLQDVSLIRINDKSDGYHLNINKKSFLRIFHGDLDSLDKVYSIEFLNVNQKIEDLIKQFDMKFIRFENAKLHYLDDSSMTLSNTSNNSSMMNKTANLSTPSTGKKIVPYSVPQQNANNTTKRPLQNPSAKTNQIQNDKNVVNCSKPVQISAKPNNANLTSKEAAKPTNRAFQFKVHNNANPTPAESSLATPAPIIRNVTSYDENAISLLLSGCGDELFDD
jgi:hypothetical protein